MRSLLGVYAADAGLFGEVSYVFGKLLGRRHCGLCDITHSPVRRKPAWDALVRDLGVEFRLAHRNELSPAEQEAVARHGAPAVFAVGADGGLTLLLDAAALDSVDGDVHGFAVLLRAALARQK